MNLTFQKMLPDSLNNAISSIVLHKGDCDYVTHRQAKYINLVDEQWLAQMLWVAYIRFPIFNIHQEPFNTSFFKSYKASGKNYSQQLDLNIGIWNFFPIPGFNSPLEWWTAQLLEIKQSELYCGLVESEPIQKKKLLSEFRRQLRILNGVGESKEQQQFIKGISQKFPQYGKLLDLSIKLANKDSEEGKNFKYQYWHPYLESIRHSINEMDKSLSHQFIYLIGEEIFYTSIRKPKKSLCA